MNCLTCKNPTEHEFYLCWDCLDGLRDVIKAVPWLIAELDVNIAKQSKRGKLSSGGSGSTSIHGAAPVDQTAMDVKGELKSALISTAAAVARITRDHPAIGSTMEQVCDWLADKSDWLALNPTLAGLHPKLLREYRKACSTIDIPADSMTVGKCGAQTACCWPPLECGALYDAHYCGDMWCERELVVRPGQRTVKCGDCGTIWDVHQRRHDALMHAWIEPARPGAIAAALKGWGMQVTLNAVQMWIKKGQLHAADEDGGYKRYRLVEAYNLAYRIERRRALRNAESA
jgi:hypothetical protein